MSPRNLTLVTVLAIVAFLSIPLWIAFFGRYHQESRLNGGERMFWYHEVVSISNFEFHEGQISDEWLVAGPFDTESLCDAELKADTKKKLDPKLGETGDECLQHFATDAGALPPYSPAAVRATPGG
jgi:hypothetical protein